MHFILLALIETTVFSQSDFTKQEMTAMTDTYQKAYKLGSVYYKIGTNTPFTGILYGKYSNGQNQTMQEYVNGVSNGK